jgi:S-adenosylmethionine-dependent methyltransferase
MSAEDAWAPLVERFVDQQGASLSGRVRRHVLAAHLREHLPPPPAALVDVGGGAGQHSIPLARQGYQVTIVDSSPAMLARARERLGGEPAEVAGRVRLIESPAEEAPRALGGAQFAGVLCHAVIMYFDDPEPLVAALADLTEPGGIVSLVAKNTTALVTQPALAGDWAQALAAFDTDRGVNYLGLDTRADTVEGLTALMGRHGLHRLAWYGVRLFTDPWTPPLPLAADAEELALEVELQASRRDPYRQMSRLFHVIAQRRPPV